MKIEDAKKNEREKRREAKKRGGQDTLERAPRYILSETWTITPLHLGCICKIII